MRTVNVAVVAPGASAIVCSGSSIATCGSPPPSRRTRASAGAIGEQADVDAERGARADVVGRGQADDRDVAALVGGQRSARKAARRDRAGARRSRQDRRASGRRREISRRRGIAVASTRPAPNPAASARSVAAPAGGGRRAIAGAFGSKAATSSARAAKRTTRGGGSPRSAAARARPATAADANPSAPSETLSETSTRTTAETARAGRRNVGPASADRDAGEHQRPQQRLRAQLAAEKSASDRRAISKTSGTTGSASSATRAFEGQSSVADRACSRRPPAVVADPLDDQQRECEPERERTHVDAAAPDRRIRGASLCPPSSSSAAGVVSDSRASPRLAAKTMLPARWKPTCAIAISGDPPAAARWRRSAGAGGASIAASAFTPGAQASALAISSGNAGASGGRSGARRSWWRRCGDRDARARSAAARRTIRRPRRRRAPAPVGAPRRC